MVINTAAGNCSLGCDYEWPLCMAGVLIMNDHWAGCALLCNLDVISQAVQNLYEQLKQECEKRGNEDRGVGRESNSTNLAKETKLSVDWMISIEVCWKIFWKFWQIKSHQANVQEFSLRTVNINLNDQHPNDNAVLYNSNSWWLNLIVFTNSLWPPRRKNFGNVFSGFILYGCIIVFLLYIVVKYKWNA